MLEDPQGSAGTGAGVGFAVVCHPHPLYGGTMQNKVVHTVARACQQYGMPSLRFDFRGVGASEGSYDQGRGEVDDALSVIAYGRNRWPHAPLTLAGFSFGAMIALTAAASSLPSRLITVAPAVGRPEFSPATGPGCPWLIVQGDADELVDVRAVREFAARVHPAPKLVVLEGAEHFFHGRLTELRERVLSFLRDEETR
jgi:alpha/beta superfamily hydrolase